MTACLQEQRPKLVLKPTASIHHYHLIWNTVRRRIGFRISTLDLCRNALEPEVQAERNRMVAPAVGKHHSVCFIRITAPGSEPASWFTGCLVQHYAGQSRPTLLKAEILDRPERKADRSGTTQTELTRYFAISQGPMLCGSCHQDGPRSVSQLESISHVAQKIAFGKGDRECPAGTLVLKASGPCEVVEKPHSLLRCASIVRP
jgi:hypothetical protein